MRWGFLAFLWLGFSGAAPKGAPPTFTEVLIGPPDPVQATGLNLGDYDNDGDLDLAVQSIIAGNGRAARLYTFNGTSFAHDTNAVFPGVTEGPFVFGDYDRDGDLDVLLSGVLDGGFSNAARIGRNEGAGGFTALDPGLLPVKGADARWFDADNDGDLDVLLGGEGPAFPGTDHVTLYRNDGGGAFSAVLDFPGIYLGQIDVGDYDRDGDDDLAITGRSIGSRVYRNDGGLNFVDLNLSLVPVDIASTVEWGDCDNDGDLDFILSGINNASSVPYCEIYRNDGGDVFTSLNAGLPGLCFGDIDWGDYDNDGDLDLLIIGTDALLSPNPVARVYRNDAGVFVDAALALAPGIVVNSGAWGDYDNDGDLDIFIASDAGVKVYRNDSTVADAAPSAPGGLTASWSGNDLALQWNASADAETPVAGLSYNLRVGTTPGGQDVMAAMADLSTGFRRLPARGNAQGNLTWTIKGLPAGTYYFSVQAVDGAFRGSAWSAELAVASPPSGPRVTGVSPTGILTAGLASVVVDLNAAPDPATVNSTSFVLTQAGPDAAHGTSDDVVVHPKSIVLAGQQVSLDVAGLQLPDGNYRLRVRGTEPALASELHRWKFDEGAGATALDAVGSLDGTLDGAALPAWTAAGRLGGAIELSGSDGRLLLGGADLAAPWTASLWVRRINSPDADARLLDSATSSLRLEQFNGTNRLGVTFPGTDFAFLAGAPVGTWTHVAFVGESTVTRLYLNGLYTQSVGFTVGCPRSVIGSVGFNSMHGRLDEVRLFSRRLTETEIGMLAGLGGVVRDLAGNPLDGEFSGPFPSGDGVGGGDFVSDFVLQAVPLQVSAMLPAPGSVLGPPPTMVSLTLSGLVDPATAARPAVRVLRAGPDAALGTGDDVEIIPTSVTLPFGNQIAISLPGGLPIDHYRVILAGSLSEPSTPLNRWRLDEATGTLAADSAGTAPGTLGGGVDGGRPRWSIGRQGYALQFYGVADRVLTGAGDVGVPWTASLWVRRAPSTAEDARLTDSLSSSLRLEQYNFSGKVGVTAGGVADASYAYGAPLGPWAHLTFVGEADGTSLYVDGVFSEKVGLVIGGSRNCLGSTSWNSMAGTLDEVRLYGRKLTDAEIRLLASLGGGLRSIGGALIDGEFSGSFPSGDAVPGGAFSADFSVYGNTPPGAFTLLTPAGAATGVSVTPTFTWTPASGAQSYTIRVSSDGTHSSFIVNQAGIVGTSFTPAAPLAPSTAHLWDVYAVNPAGSTAGVGTISSFTTAAPGPGAFALISPADAAAQVSVKPSFSWTASAGASTYTLEVAADAGFATLVVDLPGLTATSAAPGVVLADGSVYYWRVRAVNPTGSTTTAARAFSTSPGLKIGGGCGLTGWEVVALMALLRTARRRRGRTQT